MKFLTEGETASINFILSASIKIRGRRKYTKPITVKAKSLSKKELKYITNLIITYAKKQKKPKNCEG